MINFDRFFPPKNNVQMFLQEINYTKNLNLNTLDFFVSKNVILPSISTTNQIYLFRLAFIIDYLLSLLQIKVSAEDDTSGMYL